MAYATLDELKARLDWELDEDEERIGTSALEDASSLAAGYGQDWADEHAPRMVKTLVLRSCKRYMENPNGYTRTRAGDESLDWSDAAGEDAGTVYFTKHEQELLADLAGRAPGLTSATVVAWGTDIRRYRRRRNTLHPPGMVPILGGGGKDFPLFDDPDGPW